jgi:hypothetical protein
MAATGIPDPAVVIVLTGWDWYTKVPRKVMRSNSELRLKQQRQIQNNNFVLKQTFSGMVHPLMLCLLLFTLPVGLIQPFMFKVFPFSFLAGFGPPFLYLVANARQTPPFIERLKLIPLMTITGFCISLSTSIAVMEGLMGKGGNFVRTPKLNLDNNHEKHKAIDRAYLQPISPLVWGEIALGFYALLTGYILAGYVGWGIIPWMMIYVVGYFYIAGLNLIQDVPNWDGKITKSYAG